MQGRIVEETWQDVEGGEAQVWTFFVMSDDIFYIEDLLDY